ncbi:unnamed protein product [Diamesa hyperborea]
MIRNSHFSTKINTLFQCNFDKYYAKVQSDENLIKSRELHGLLENYNKLSVGIKDIEKELSNKNVQDIELSNLMKDEKVELSSKQTELTEQILNEIYEYEQSKDVDKINDSTSVLFEISAGVGGKEAMLFANELFEMYYNYFNYKNWDLTDVEIDEQGGYLRHYQANIAGRNVYGHLNFEAGVHRVQRVPETESKGRVHTSTVSVACIPITDESVINVIDKDLKIQTMRASGAGGQHVNKTESAIRITHIPTNISVECQEDRSQVKNREIAIRKLQKILTDRFYKETFDKVSKTRKSQVGQSNRNEKIRTYNFNQDRVTDHRLSSQNSNQNDKEDTHYNLESFFQSPSRLDEFITSLKKVEKERSLLELFNSLDNVK